MALNPSDWLEILGDVLEDVATKFSDDGKLTIPEIIGLCITIIKSISSHLREANA